MEIRGTKSMVGRRVDQSIPLINEVALCKPPDPMETHHSKCFLMHRNTSKFKYLEGPHVTLPLVQFEFLEGGACGRLRRRLNHHVRWTVSRKIQISFKMQNSKEKSCSKSHGE